MFPLNMLQYNSPTQQMFWMMTHHLHNSCSSWTQPMLCGYGSKLNHQGTANVCPFFFFTRVPFWVPISEPHAVYLWVARPPCRACPIDRCIAYDLQWSAASATRRMSCARTHIHICSSSMQPVLCSYWEGAAVLLTTSISLFGSVHSRSTRSL